MDGIEEGASVAVDGCCLTVSAISDDVLQFEVVTATQRITTLGKLRQGDKVNVERSLKFGDEVGGHILSGRIASTVEVTDYQSRESEATLTFRVPKEWRKFLMTKGFIALNGASLTLASFDSATGCGTINLIPETLKRTNLGSVRIGDHLNLEVDSTTQTIVQTVERLFAEGQFSTKS